MGKMKTAQYKTDKGIIEVVYDPDSPCRVCGQPVIEASVGGTAICPWCDSGYRRDGTQWTYSDYIRYFGRPGTR